MNLTDAGTSFESGVRRSKRMKTRPLEYWKGERLLYGRVDEGEYCLVNSCVVTLLGFCWIHLLDLGDRVIIHLDPQI